MYHELFRGHNVKSKHFNWYCTIIEQARQREPLQNCYTERHHILPRSMGGSDESLNLVDLTAKEHYVCHHLLYMFTEGPDKHKMALAWNMMCWGKGKNGDRPLYYSANSYKLAKMAFAKAISTINSGPNPKLSHTLRNKSKYGKTKQLFYNVDSQTHLYGTKFDLVDFDPRIGYGEVDRIIDNPNKCSKGWMVQTSDTIPVRDSFPLGSDSPNADNKIYEWVDTINNELFSCTRHELIDKYSDRNLTPQGITDLIKRRQKSHRNIRLL